MGTCSTVGLSALSSEAECLAAAEARVAGLKAARPPVGPSGDWRGASIFGSVINARPARPPGLSANATFDDGGTLLPLGCVLDVRESTYVFGKDDQDEAHYRFNDNVHPEGLNPTCSETYPCLCGPFEAPPCDHPDGMTEHAISAQCTCGAVGACTVASGRFCNSESALCADHKIPTCTIDDGSAPNEGACACGAPAGVECNDATGLVCLAAFAQCRPDTQTFTTPDGAFTGPSCDSKDGSTPHIMAPEFATAECTNANLTADQSACETPVFTPGKCTNANLTNDLSACEVPSVVPATCTNANLTVDQSACETPVFTPGKCTNANLTNDLSACEIPTFEPATCTNANLTTDQSACETPVFSNETSVGESCSFGGVLTANRTACEAPTFVAATCSNGGVVNAERSGCKAKTFVPAKCSLGGVVNAERTGCNAPIFLEKKCSFDGVLNASGTGCKATTFVPANCSLGGVVKADRTGCKAAVYKMPGGCICAKYEVCGNVQDPWREGRVCRTKLSSDHPNHCVPSPPCSDPTGKTASSSPCLCSKSSDPSVRTECTSRTGFYCDGRAGSCQSLPVCAPIAKQGNVETRACTCGAKGISKHHHTCAARPDADIVLPNAGGTIFALQSCDHTTGNCTNTEMASCTTNVIGTAKNDPVPCVCGGKAVCSEDAPYCSALRGECMAVPACAIIDASAENEPSNPHRSCADPSSPDCPRAAPCICGGEEVCDTETGLFCYGALRQCSKTSGKGSFYVQNDPTKTAPICDYQDGSLPHVSSQDACICGNEICEASSSGLTCTVSASARGEPACGLSTPCGDQSGLKNSTALEGAAPVCSCGGKRDCTVDRPYCFGDTGTCAVGPKCKYRFGSVANEAPCLCGSADCTSPFDSGMFCFASLNGGTCVRGPRVPTESNPHSTAKCQFTDGKTKNSASPECKCGEAICNEARTGMYCYASLSQCRQNKLQFNAFPAIVGENNFEEIEGDTDAQAHPVYDIGTCDDAGRLCGGKDAPGKCGVYADPRFFDTTIRSSIKTRGECEAAAQFVGLRSPVAAEGHWGLYPAGCFFYGTFGTQLYFNTNEASGVPCGGAARCLCTTPKGATCDYQDGTRPHKSTSKCVCGVDAMCTRGLVCKAIDRVSQKLLTHRALCKSDKICTHTLGESENDNFCRCGDESSDEYCSITDGSGGYCYADLKQCQADKHRFLVPGMSEDTDRAPVCDNRDGTGPPSYSKCICGTASLCDRHDPAVGGMCDASANDGRGACWPENRCRYEMGKLQNAHENCNCGAVKCSSVTGMFCMAGLSQCSRTNTEWGKGVLFKIRHSGTCEDGDMYQPARAAVPTSMMSQSNGDPEEAQGRAPFERGSEEGSSWVSIRTKLDCQFAVQSTLLCQTSASQTPSGGTSTTSPFRWWAKRPLRGDAGMCIDSKDPLSLWNVAMVTTTGSSDVLTLEKMPDEPEGCLYFPFASLLDAESLASRGSAIQFNLHRDGITPHCSTQRRCVCGFDGQKPCDFTDGTLPHLSGESCVCGHTLCTADTGLVCLADAKPATDPTSITRCSHAEPCLNVYGAKENSPLPVFVGSIQYDVRVCSCGAAAEVDPLTKVGTINDEERRFDCTEASGFYCNSRAGWCSKFPNPDCENKDATVENKGRCACGDRGQCTTRTGMYCYKPLDHCAKAPRLNQTSYTIVDDYSSCEDAPNAAWIEEQDECEWAATVVGWRETAEFEGKEHPTNPPPPAVEGVFVQKPKWWEAKKRLPRVDAGDYGSAQYFPRGCFMQEAISPGFGKEAAKIVSFNTRPPTTVSPTTDQELAILKTQCNPVNPCVCSFTAPICDLPKGVHTSSQACICGKSGTCTSKTGLNCDASTSTCSPAPACKHYEGSTANSGVCLCGTRDCTESSGYFCYMKASMCSRKPIVVCKNQRGAVKNVALKSPLCINGRLNADNSACMTTTFVASAGSIKASCTNGELNADESACKPTLYEEPTECQCGLSTCTAGMPFCYSALDQCSATGSDFGQDFFSMIRDTGMCADDADGYDAIATRDGCEKDTTNVYVPFANSQYTKWSFSHPLTPANLVTEEVNSHTYPPGCSVKQSGMRTDGRLGGMLQLVYNYDTNPIPQGDFHAECSPAKPCVCSMRLAPCDYTDGITPHGSSAACVCGTSVCVLDPGLSLAQKTERTSRLPFQRPHALYQFGPVCNDLDHDAFIKKIYGVPGRDKLGQFDIQNMEKPVPLWRISAPRCSPAPTCRYTDGTRKNDGVCTCGDVGTNFIPDSVSKLQTTCWEATGFYCYKDRGICATFPTCDRAEPNTKCQCGAKAVCDKSTGFYCDPVADLCSPTSFFSGFSHRQEGLCGDSLGMTEITSAETCFAASKFVTRRGLTCSGAASCSLLEENKDRWSVRRDVIARNVGTSQAAIEKEKQRKAAADPQMEVPPMGCSILVDPVSRAVQEPVFRLLPTARDCPSWQQYGPEDARNGTCIEDVFTWTGSSEKGPCIDERDVVGYGALQLTGKNPKGKATLAGQCYSQTSLMKWIQDDCPSKDITFSDAVKEARAEMTEKYTNIFKPDPNSERDCDEQAWWSDKNEDILKGARPDGNGEKITLNGVRDNPLTRTPDVSGYCGIMHNMQTVGFKQNDCLCRARAPRCLRDNRVSPNADAQCMCGTGTNAQLGSLPEYCNQSTGFSCRDGECGFMENVCIVSNKVDPKTGTMSPVKVNDEACKCGVQEVRYGIVKEPVDCWPGSICDYKTQSCAFPECRNTDATRRNYENCKCGDANCILTDEDRAKGVGKFCYKLLHQCSVSDTFVVTAAFADPAAAKRLAAQEANGKYSKYQLIENRDSCEAAATLLNESLVDGNGKSTFSYGVSLVGSEQSPLYPKGCLLLTDEEGLRMGAGPDGDPRTVDVPTAPVINHVTYNAAQGPPKKTGPNGTYVLIDGNADETDPDAFGQNKVAQVLLVEPMKMCQNRDAQVSVEFYSFRMFQSRLN